MISSEARRRASRVEVISAKALSPRQALQLFVDAVEATGLVIQQKGDTIIIKPGPGSFAACDEPVVHGAPSAGEIADDLIAALGAGVRVRGPMLREIDRALLDRVLAQPIAATRNARILPAVRAGRPIGFTLEAIDPAGVLARLGFANGDTVLMVDGVPLTSAERALEAYARLRGAKQIEVAIERRGAPAALVIVVN